MHNIFSHHPDGGDLALPRIPANLDQFAFHSNLKYALQISSGDLSLSGPSYLALLCPKSIGLWSAMLKPWE